MKYIQKCSKKVISLTMTLLMLLSFCIVPNSVYAIDYENEDLISINATSYLDENLITNVVNSPTGNIRFTINAPSHCDVVYRVYAKTDYYNGACDATDGRVVNSGNSTGLIKTIYVPVNLMGEYEVKAYLDFGVPSQTAYDIDSCMSKFIGTKYSPKFTWTQEEINKYNNGTAIAKTFVLAGMGTIDLLVTKGILSTAGVLIATWAYNIIDIITTDESLNVTDIEYTPILGFSYQYKFVATSSGYNTYIMITNNNNTETYPVRYTSFDELSRIR